MKVYFVRHGESVENAKGIHQDGEAALSDIGEWQAKQVAHRFKDIQIEALIASHYVRAQQTAQAINEHKHLPLETDKTLHEFVRPTEVVGHPYGDPEIQTIKSEIDTKVTDRIWHYSDEENAYEFFTRVSNALHSLTQRSESEIAVVTHGIVLGAILYLIVTGGKITDETLLSLPYIRQKRLTHSNTGITVCEYEDGQWSLRTWNDDAHLG